MDAPILRFGLMLFSLVVATGANYQTPNFIVTAPTPEVAKQVGDAAETYRRELAIFWLDRPLPNWSRPCVLKVRPGAIGAGGETRFQFTGGEVVNWNMYVQGSLERILDSVLPHEVNHTIFACHFRRPLPRWADEGAATLFEHRSEQIKQLGLLNQVINNDREFISLDNLLTMKEYPKGYRPMLILYAQGYALADFLVQQGGRKKYLKFLADGERMGWPEAIKANYHHGGVESLQKNWRGWILAGMPKLKLPKDEMLAGSEAIAVEERPIDQRLGVARPEILDEYLADTTVRLQSPDAPDSNVASASAGSQSQQASTASTDDLPKFAAAQTRPATAQAAGVRSSTPPVKSLQGAVFFNPPNSASTTTATAQAQVPRNSPLPPARQQPQTRQQPPSRQQPSSRQTPAPGRSPRSATFEAPAPRLSPRMESRTEPRPATGTIQDSSRRTPESLSGQAAFEFEQGRHTLEPTALNNALDFTQSAAQPLPQERKAVTGSVPQWAGFPGQTELF